jgi:hypothetical protein
LVRKVDVGHLEILAAGQVPQDIFDFLDHQELHSEAHGQLWLEVLLCDLALPLNNLLGFDFEFNRVVTSCDCLQIPLALFNDDVAFEVLDQ